MKYIELPRRVIVGDGAIHRLRDVIEELGLKGNSLVISDPTTKEIAGDNVRREIDASIYTTRGTPDSEVERILLEIKRDEIRYLIGVGGGRIIDITKLAAFKAGIPFLSVPTAASHDGITSPQVSIKRSTPISIKAHCPIGVIADTAIIRKAPERLLAAGCADVISNYTAVLDWKLANKERGEYYGDYAATLAMMSAQIVMHNAEKIMDDISILVEALISSGVAIGIAGSSRPCSGAEHNFSHVLDRICPNPALHGEQCGVGSIMMAYLHEAEWERVRDSLKKVKAPINAKELGIEDNYIVEALTKAHKIRDRYTILRDGLSREKAIELAKITGVIE
ncbi:MAG: NAD(P)-dependent glycerol-1-phosphate dehydrogenase [Candidatus Altiarchaeales archaeon]|nr:MAG: NAD(P)-dependent glycerol-1-phosphate dehydrogenase [Candidatus Altiarchaeales archaeon]